MCCLEKAGGSWSLEDVSLYGCVAIWSVDGCVGRNAGALLGRAAGNADDQCVLAEM